MNKKAFAAGLAAGAAVYAGIGMLVSYELTAKDAKLPKYVIGGFNKVHNIPSEEKKDDRVEWFRANPREEFTRVNDRGQTLHAFYMPTDKPSDKYIICAHGYRSCGQGEFRFAGKFFHDNGYNVIFVDHQAAGVSDGKFISFGKYESKDFVDWINYFVDKFGKDIQIALYGISMGSATVMMSSCKAQLPENVKFIVADCGYTSVEELFTIALKSIAHIPAAKPIMLPVDFFSGILGKWKFNEAMPIEAVKGAKAPILFIHGEDDPLVPPFMCDKLYGACCTEKDILFVPDAGHAESYQKNSAMYEEKFLEFAAKYIK